MTRNASPHVVGSLRFAHEGVPQEAVLTHLYARRLEDEEVPRMHLLFCDRPLSAAELAAPERLVRRARAGEFMALSAEIDTEGELRTSELLHRGGCFSGSWRCEATATPRLRIAGQITTDGEREFFGAPYAVDVRFDVAPPLDSEWTGSPLRQIGPTGLAVGCTEGTFIRGETIANVHHAVLARDRDLFGDLVMTGLYLASSPILPRHFTAPNGPLHALAAEGIAAIRLNLDASHAIESVSLSDMHAGEGGGIATFTSTEYTIESIATAESGIDGTASAGAAGDGDQDFLRFEVRFHAPLDRAASMGPVTAEDGTALHSHGGDPGVAFLAARRALRSATSLADILPFRSGELTMMIASVPAEQHPMVLAMLQAEGAPEVRIVGGFTSEDHATLWLSGTHEGAAVEGRVQLHREREQWKVGIEAYRPPM